MVRDLNAAIRRYRENGFKDDDIVHCTGLSVRAQRELIKLKAIRTEEVGRGPGRVRICDRTTFKRAAVISALNGSGLSLAVAGQIAFFFPFHTVLYEVCDPFTILFQHKTEIDPQTGLPPRVKRPMIDWFDPLKPAQAEAEADWLIEIFDGRFVGVRYDTTKGAAIIFGDLRQQGTQFVAWLPFPRRDQFAGSAIERIAQEMRGDGLIRFVADWEDPSKWTMQLRRLGYHLESHDSKTDPLRIAAETAACSPVFKSTINVTLAVRKALRRYLGIEPTAPFSEIGERP